VRVYILSDVVGDDVTVVGSGPCSPDRTTAQKLRARLAAAGMLQRLPAAIADIIDRTERGMFPETPKRGDPAFRNVTEHVIGSNALAVAAAGAAAAEAGMLVRNKRTPLTGDAAHMGHLIGRRLVDEAMETGEPVCLVGGGETTVSIGETPAGRGGRCQELALAVARELHGLSGARVALLAAGTDGQDGPTDAAGAIIDHTTWQALIDAGRDPDLDLARHDSGEALDAVGALIRTGATGTNVNDVLFAVVRPD
jgi:glycerate-2-kinase